MGRAIIAAAAPAVGEATRGVPDGDAPAATGNDEYSDKLLKLIPAEIITLYMSMTKLVSDETADQVAAAVPWVIFGFCAFATWFYMRVTLKVTDWRQLSLTVLAFCIWAFALGDPFTSVLSWYEDVYAGLLLAGYTFMAPKIPMGRQG